MMRTTRSRFGRGWPRILAAGLMLAAAARQDAFSQERHAPQSRPTAVGEAYYFGKLVGYEIVDGAAVHDGDIVLDTAEDLARRERMLKGPNRKQANFVAEEESLWPDGVVYYTIHANLENPERVLEAMKVWSAAAPVRFVERTDQQGYVEFRSGSGCSAAVGYRGRRQYVWLAQLCSPGAVQHEIGHALGLWHEHTRIDRGEYIVIDEDQIDRSTGLSNIVPLVRPPNNGVSPAYDYASIMHYSATAFSKTGLPGIETIPPGMPIGQRRALSVGDIDAVKRLYDRPPATTTITTNPAGLPILVDGQTYAAPQAFAWDRGSTHVIGVPQQHDDPLDADVRYLFGRWSDDGAREHEITVGEDATWHLASFVQSIRYEYGPADSAQGSVSIAPASEDGFYTLRAPVTLTAEPADGNYFTGWSGRAQFSLTGLAANPIRTLVFSTASRLEASFDDRPPTSLDSNHPGMRAQIDGRTVFLPAFFRWPPGERVEIAIQPIQLGRQEASRFVFEGWDDGAGAERTLDVPEGGRTYTALFRKQHEFLHSAAPASYGSLILSPAPDASRYYDEGATVTIAAVPEENRSFLAWTGDLDGGRNPQRVTVDRQHVVRAFMGPFDNSLEAGIPRNVRLPARPRSMLHGVESTFAVEVPPDAVRLELQLMTAATGAEVDLHVRHEDFPIQLPNGAIADDHRAVGAEQVKTVVITPDSAPPLLPGLYIAAFANRTVDVEIEASLTAFLEGGGALPAVSAAPRALTFAAAVDGSPPEQSIEISNAGSGALYFLAEAADPWLSVAPTQGSTEAGPVALTVAIEDTHLPPGTYRSTVSLQRVRHLGALKSSAPRRAVPVGRVDVPVTLLVNAPEGGTPMFSAAGVVSAAGFVPPLAPGGIGSLFGSDLAGGTAAASAALPRELDQVQVLIDGVAAPLFFVSPTQINFQAPFETPADRPVGVRVVRNLVASATAERAFESTGLAVFTDTVSGLPIALRPADGSLITAGNPARPGDVLTVYATGLGFLDRRPRTGLPSAGGAALSRTTAALTAALGETEADVLFAGLAPGFVGLAQLNLRLAETLPAGPSAPLIFTVAGVPTAPVNLPVP